MTNNLPVLFVEQFTTNVQFLSQQKGSRLRKTVMNGTHVGSQAAAVDQFAAVNALKVTTRYAPMGRVDGGLDRRWVFPVDYELPQLVDSFDKLRLIIDPTSYLLITVSLQCTKVFERFNLGSRKSGNGNAT